MKKTLLTISIIVVLFLINGCEDYRSPVSTSESQISYFNPNLTVIMEPNACIKSQELGPEIIDPNVSPCGETKVLEIWPNPCYDAGSVTIYNDDENLYLTVYSDAGYQEIVGQIKVWVGTDLTALPGGGMSLPDVDLFPYQFTVNAGEVIFTAVIPLDEIQGLVDCDEPIFAVIYADLLVADGQGGTIPMSGWAGDILGPDFPPNWWVYTTYVVKCCPIYNTCDTAFGKGGWVFASHPNANPENLPSLDLTRQRWGWAINIDNVGDHMYEIWAGAGLNDTSAGTLVGTLWVTKVGDEVTISYYLDPGYAMFEAHIFADDFMPTTISPGQYGHTVEFENGADIYEHTFTIEDTDGDGIWIIAHADVCWEE